ncbi:hypothetical protein [Bradyrhizobium sp. dw_411]|uniref:hypothetical protein n=1 Tax=Bradyrhizobium sp. dw_411 TaxID=2720082 RepID=UPI00201BEA9A|nr:hypothetical protein [Bradyrhizobium sp. dw_411]
MISLKRISETTNLIRKRSVRSVLLLGLAATVVAWSGVSFADRLVDPNTVAPEYRDVAEKRRAEQLKLFQCSQKADAAKVLRRDRAAFVSECVDK